MVSDASSGPAGGGAAGSNQGRGLLSIVTPAYSEAENLPAMYERLCAVLATLDLDWEWVIVDDHSPDATFEVASELAAHDRRVRAVRFSRNFGSHTAIFCGLELAAGDCCVVMAADLQDPPERIPALVERWSGGAKVVWAVREARQGERLATVGSSRVYYWMLRRIAGMKQLPAAGADFLLMDRIVVDAFREFRESNVSVLALISWMGFRQESIGYEKEARIHGRSGWTLRKKLKLLVDSITSFSYLPIRVMTYVGVSVALAGFVYALFLIVNAIGGHPVRGWTALMVVVLVLGGIQMVMTGVLGEYLWRSLDESRRRPRYLIEETTGPAGEGRARSGHPR